MVKIVKMFTGFTTFNALTALTIFHQQARSAVQRQERHKETDRAGAEVTCKIEP